MLATTVSKAEQRFDPFPRDFFTHLVKVLLNHRQNLALSGSRESERRRPVCDGEAKGVVHNRCNHRQSSLTRVTIVI